jgi:hypothetical protein
MSQRLATVRAAWNGDRSKLVTDTADDAAVLAYPVGAQLADEDEDAYDAFLSTLGVDPDAEHGGDGAEPQLAAHRVWLDGKGNLVHERDPLAVSLLYAVNDTVDADRVEEYQAMGDAPESNAGSGIVIVKEADKRANKARTSASNKGKAQTRATAGAADSSTATDGDGKAATTTVTP